MSVPEQDPVTLHTGNGVTTVFAYQFLLTLAADILVTVGGVVKTLNVDYTVSGLGIEAGGDVTFTVAPAAATSIILQRDIALKRDTDYQNFGDFKADTVNADIDRVWMALQGTQEELDRSIRVAPDSPAVDLELPAPVALTYLRWNSLASKLEAVLLADISLISLTAYAQTLLNAADAVAARVVLGATTVGSAVFTAVTAAAARLAMGAAASSHLRGYLNGLTFSTVGPSTTMTIGPGVAQDSTNTTTMSLAAALDKTAANFVQGNAAGGKFRAAAIANNATYHWYLVYSPTTEEYDVGFSTVATGLVAADYVAGGGNLPDKFTKFAYIKPWRTNGSAQWASWIDRGGNFIEFVTPVLDINHVVTVTTAVTEVLASIPTGIKVRVKFAGGLVNGSAANLAYYRFSALDTADLAPSPTVAPLSQQNYAIAATGGSEATFATHEIWTDTAASIRMRVSAAAAAITARASVEGFFYYR
jgi:hypothetical protein